MRLAGYALDVGPWKNISIIVGCAAQLHHMTMAAGGGPLVGLDLLSGRPDVFLSAISSLKPEAEIELGVRASGMDPSVPWIVIPDIPETWRRPKLLPHVSNVAVAIVSHQQEVVLAEAWGYPRAIFLGLPPLWGNFLRTALTFEGVRCAISKRLNGRGPHAVMRTDVLAVVGGPKSATVMNTMLQGVVAAGKTLFRDRFVLAPRFHPREDPPAEPNERQEILADTWVADTSAFRTLEGLIPGANLMVNTLGATATCYCALLRAPVITFIDEAGAEHFELQIGRRNWLPVEGWRVSLEAHSTDELADAVSHAFSPEGALQLTENQKTYYPDELLKEAVTDPTEEMIVQFLEQELKRR